MAMDSESQKLAQDTFALAQENNKMLHSIRRGQRITAFMSFLYWVIVIGVAVGSFYYIQPYVDKIQKFVQDSGVTLDQLKSFGNKLK